MISIASPLEGLGGGYIRKSYVLPTIELSLVDIATSEELDTKGLLRVMIRTCYSILNFEKQL